MVKRQQHLNNPSRRRFLKRAGGFLAGAFLSFYVPRFVSFGARRRGVPRIQYRTLGRTGLRASEVGFGGYPVSDPRVVEYALDQGINYIDTSDCYRTGRSEETIGKALKHRRDEVILTTKFDAFSRTTKEQMLEWIDASLRRLQTDHVDFILVHQIGKASGGESTERLQNPELYEAFSRAKRQGKVRYLGCSGHDGDLMQVMDYAIEIPEISLILCRYNFLAYPVEPELFKKAKAKGVATVAMKTLAGARGEDLSTFKDQYTTYKQAALKWVLSNRDLCNLVISVASKQQIDEYVLASGTPLYEQDHAVLAAYAATFGTQVCRMCNACEPACDQGVRIADILRYRMYSKEYHMPEEGRRLYAAIPRSHQGAQCADCLAPCVSRCDYGIDIPKELRTAHKILTG